MVKLGSIDAALHALETLAAQREIYGSRYLKIDKRGFASLKVNWGPCKLNLKFRPNPDAIRQRARQLSEDVRALERGSAMTDNAREVQRSHGSRVKKCRQLKFKQATMDAYRDAGEMGNATAYFLQYH